MIILPRSSTKPSSGDMIREPAGYFAYEMLPMSKKQLSLQMSFASLLINLNVLSCRPNFTVALLTYNCR